MSDTNPAMNVLVYIGPHPDDAIGENLIKLPFLRAIAQTFPGAQITWVHGHDGSMFEGILEPLARSLIHEVLPDTFLGHGWASALCPTRLLRGRHFDVIIDTQKNPRHTMALRRISYGMFISSTWRYFFSSRRPSGNSPKAVSLAEKLFALLDVATGTKVARTHCAIVPQAYSRTAATILPDGETYIGLAPGAGRTDTGKCWPLEQYISVAQQQSERGRKPVFFLGPQELDWRGEIEAAVPDALFAPLEAATPDGEKLGGPTLTVALGSQLSAAVANCSGTGHMLAAGGAPMVSLFGPTSPRKFAPYTPDISIIRAQDFGSSEINVIPEQAVLNTIEDRLAGAS